MKRISVGFASVLAFAGIAWACSQVPSVVAPLLQVSITDSHAATWQKIGQHLDASFSDSYQASEIIQVRVPVRACLLGVCGASMDVFFLKPCNKTMKEAAEEIAEGPEDAPPPPPPPPSGGGGSGGGGDLVGGGGAGGGGPIGGGCYGNCNPSVIVGPIMIP